MLPCFIKSSYLAPYSHFGAKRQLNLAKVPIIYCKLYSFSHMLCFQP
jgi:hypothetical protein